MHTYCMYAKFHGRLYSQHDQLEYLIVAVHKLVCAISLRSQDEAEEGAPLLQEKSSERMKHSAKENVVKDDKR